MQVKDLPPATLAAIKETRYDRIIEKHEGPETWDWQFRKDDPDSLRFYEMWKQHHPEMKRPADAEFLQIGGADVLLPVSADHHPNMTILHYFFSEDRSKMVLYIKDTTYDDSTWGAGFVAICDKYPGHDFYLASFYHEWFVIDYDPLADLWRKSK